MIPYGRHWVDDSDVEAVISVLRSDWLTTGPTVDAFEHALASLAGARHGVAVSSGTAALHVAMFAAGIGPGDEVIVPAITFVATANAALYLGATPVFVDLEPDTLLLEPDRVRDALTARTRAIVAVDYGGQPCDYDALRQIADARGLTLIGDACHSLGASYKGRRVGTLADLTVLSFHPVKHITTGEGGMVLTDRADWASRMRAFRNHGITKDHRRRAQQATWEYEMEDLGYNYRITDFQSALGISQLSRLSRGLQRRTALAGRYDEALRDLPLAPLVRHPDRTHAHHLYVVRLALERLTRGREHVFQELRRRDIGVNVHYLPVYLHPYYRRRFGTGPGLCPVAERAYERILTLPLHPRLKDAEVELVIEATREVLAAARRPE
jgi:perosamine synthetase